jgi:microcystin-dependent protein
MSSTFSPALRIELIASGSQSGVWGNTTNNNLGDLIEQAVSGATDLNVTSGDITLTALNGVVDQARSAVLSIVGSAGVTRTVTIPNVSKTYTVKNRSDATINLKTASGTAFEIPTLSEAYVYCNGDDVITGRVITDGANAVNSLPDPFNNAALTGVPTAPTASLGTDTTQVATTAFVQDATAVAIPSGVIMMWSGSIGSIPAGFLLCNGASGTPDLRDRFVVGAGSTYSPGNTGGANTVTLTTAQLPSHAHSISGSGNTGNNNVGHNHTFNVNSGNQSANHSHAVNDPGHFHGRGRVRTGLASGNNPNLGSVEGNTTTAFTGISLGNNNANHFHNVAGTTANNSANHFHAFSFSGTSGAEGSGSAHENRPPYYALAYIMKT